MEFFGVIRTDKAVVQKVNLNLNKNVTVYIKREDAVHPELSGNKWRKLKYNLIEAEEKGYKTLLTFGGAFSNHIYAVAAAGNLFGFETIGIIRGEEHLPLNPTLKFAVKNGMRLTYLPRSTYRKRNDPDFQNRLAKEFGEVYIVPEGGSNLLALKGVAEMIGELENEYDFILSAVGSGGTAAGIISALKGKNNYIGIPVLKGGEYLKRIISDFVFNFTGDQYKNWRLETDYHFGGFAKINSRLIEFIETFERYNNLRLDPIYTGKMFCALEDLIAKGKIPAGSKVLAIHTGGLQGNEGMKGKIARIKILSGNRNDANTSHLYSA